MWILNDCIIREATERGLPLLELRLVCNEDPDFANPIEPSVQGGQKIAGAIATLLLQHDFVQRFLRDHERSTRFVMLAGR